MLTRKCLPTLSVRSTTQSTGLWTGSRQNNSPSGPMTRPNSIAWLVWHLTRVQDDHVADVATHGQVWLEGGWVERFGLPLAQVTRGTRRAATRWRRSPCPRESCSPVTTTRSTATPWTLSPSCRTRPRPRGGHALCPSVTLGVRLGSVIADDLQHAGQAPTCGHCAASLGRARQRTGHGC